MSIITLVTVQTGRYIFTDVESRQELFKDGTRHRGKIKGDVNNTEDYK